MNVKRQINIEIDKITKSVENTITGDSFKTEIHLLSEKDLKQFRKTDWLFDWRAETKQKDKLIFKLTIADNPKIIQG